MLAFSLIAPDPARAAGRRFDLPGALTATVGVTLVVFAIVQGPQSGWSSPIVVASAIGAAALLLGFTVIETHSHDPLLPRRLLGNRNLRTGVAVTFAYLATLGTLLYFLTVYFQNVRGYSALQTGLAS